MDIDKIVAEVLKRIQAKENIEQEIIKTSEPDTDKLPKILVISRMYHQGCQPLNNIDILKDNYKIDYAVDSKYKMCPRPYKEILVLDVDNTSLSKLSQGIFDTPYLHLIENAIMAGKKISLATDKMRFLEYRKEEPAAFHRFFQQRLDVLRQWGIEIVTEDQMVTSLIANISKSQVSSEAYGKTIKKRIITQGDINKAYQEGEKQVTVLEKAMITDLAKEFASQNGIDIHKVGEM